jgi:hypothetical protein
MRMAATMRRARTLRTADRISSNPTPANANAKSELKNRIRWGRRKRSYPGTTAWTTLSSGELGASAMLRIRPATSGRT